jgi:hypothetical protein
MKKYVVLLTVALAGSVAAQQATPQSHAKPSAQMKSHPLSRPTTVAASSPVAAQWSLPAATAIRMKLETPLSTDANKRGDRFGGRVVEAVTVNGQTIIPVGSALEGQVIRAESKRRIRGLPTLDLSPDTVTLPNGQKYTIRATIVDDASDHKMNVNEEGEIKGQGRNGGDWIETGAASLVGAGVGAAIGGGKGALIGTSVGAGASLIHWLTKTKSASLPAGTELVMQLSRPFQLAASDGD